MDIYSIGEMVIDFTPGEEPASYVRNAGGAPANVAIAAARCGLDTGMCCSVGDDDFGRFLISVLEENQVEVLHPALCENAITTMAFVTLDDSGDRKFTFARKPGADMFIEEEDVRSDDIQRSTIVHAGSCSLSAEPAASATRRALRLGKEYGKLVSFDVNYRDLMWNNDSDACVKAVRDILPYVDIMKISEEEAALFGGEEYIFELMATYQLTAVVETLGSRGARVFWNGKAAHCASQDSGCVDATAAGDAFWGAFLSFLIKLDAKHASDLDMVLLKDAAKFGNAAGAICVQTKGAIRSLPTREKIWARFDGDL